MDSSILFVLQSTIHVASDWRALSSSLWTSLRWCIEVVDALSYIGSLQSARPDLDREQEGQVGIGQGGDCWL
ncbi:Os04g0374650 [Oryza sativa Japonica Group]|uniref:Os04g0374650 protein n=1 Tax=Oryza sativa subsp. japonica TaxID=39947 RepID=A0A0P0W9Q1_ORYSJ|nr:Os04g0374650 [Oryza sativa Japonica Group]